MQKRVAFFFLVLLAAGASMAVAGSYYDSGITPQPTPEFRNPLPAHILLIQDQAGWGYDMYIQVLAASGVPYDVINSGSIASWDFTQYDKIITAGQQPDAYYYAIQTNRQKFEDFMNAGGCCSFEVANYFGYANEQITWPGGFTCYNNGGSNSITIDDPASPLMTTPNTVTLNELQNWNYSSHGNMSNLPASYVSVLYDGMGSCAGTFSFGAGGAAVSHQPLEWAYGFGYSQNYPPNFALYECGGPPVPVQEMSWGQVKSIYR